MRMGEAIVSRSVLGIGVVCGGHRWLGPVHGCPSPPPPQKKTPPQEVCGPAAATYYSCSSFALCCGVFSITGTGHSLRGVKATHVAHRITHAAICLASSL